MIVQCPDCTTRYELDERRVPPGRIRVRCARCRYVFPIEAARAAASVSGASRPVAADPGITHDAWSSGAARPASRPVPAERLDVEQHRRTARPKVEAEPMAGIQSTRIQIEDSSAAVADPGLDLVIERPSVGRDAPPERGAAQKAQASGRRNAAVAEPAVETEEDPGVRKARRLARALVSDILVYNRDKRDRALADGTLVQALGQEIKKSWELYKERVTPEVASSSNHFKEALNEILADGQKIF